MVADASRLRRPPVTGIVDGFALAALVVFAFGYVGGRAIANVGLGLLLLVFLLRLPSDGRMFLNDPLGRLGLVWMSYVLALAAWAKGRFPGTEQFEALPEVWSFAFIPLVALASRGDSRRVLITLLAALCGLMFRMARDLNFDGGPWLRYEAFALGGGRNLAVLFIDVGLLGCVALLVALACHQVSHRRAAFAALVACVAALLYAWVAARSRTSIVALPLALLALMVLQARRGDQRRRRYAGMLGVVLSLALAAAVLARLPAILAEMTKDVATWQAIFSGRLDTVQVDATGYRVHMWQLAYARWIEHPLTGIGPSVAHLLGSDPQRPFLAGFNQFHNSYVEILLRTGLIGVGFYLAAAWLVGRAAVAMARAGRMPWLLLDFLLVSLGVYLLLSGANSILFFQQGWHFIVLFGGLAYGYRWLPIQARNLP